MHPQILFEDNHLLVVVKPPNVLVQADDTGDRDLLTILKEGIAKRYNKKGNVFLGLIHRLDRPVGGVMVFARTSKSASRLSEQVRKNLFKKTYHAVITGNIPKSSALQDFLKKDRQHNMVSVVGKNVDGGKDSRLSYKTLQKKDNLSLVEINLETGRSHQIRVQFASRKASLWGDNRYGDGKPGEQIALWARSLAFCHPTTKEELKFDCLPPKTEPWIKFNV